MNPDLARLHPYPFEQLRTLLTGVTPDPAYAPISLSIGEPRHPTPPFITNALAGALGGLASYPATAGSEALRAGIAAWLAARYGIPMPDAATQILPVTGTREALFAIAQAIVDRSRTRPRVVCPNPFYQIYEGAALLAGADPLYADADPRADFAIDYRSLTEAEWSDVQLVYTCSPANPTGRVMNLADWRELFALSDRYGFVIVSDECYSEIYMEGTPPLGALEAAHRLGRSGYPRLLSFTSLSKRSNVPGLRSGFVAGEAQLIAQFLLYRTYHGCAMSLPVQAASIAAWADEHHVKENRSLYRRKFSEVVPVLGEVFETRQPEAAFYLWLKTPIDDAAFARQLYAAYNVLVLPGSYLGRAQRGENPGHGYVRLALVAEPHHCLEAAQRIVRLAQAL